jgi:hypothetical protein
MTSTKIIIISLLRYYCAFLRKSDASLALLGCANLDLARRYSLIGVRGIMRHVPYIKAGMLDVCNEMYTKFFYCYALSVNEPLCFGVVVNIRS